MCVNCRVHSHGGLVQLWVMHRRIRKSVVHPLEAVEARVAVNICLVWRKSNFFVVIFVDDVVENVTVTKTKVVDPSPAVQKHKAILLNSGMAKRTGKISVTIPENIATRLVVAAAGVVVTNSIDRAPLALRIAVVILPVGSVFTVGDSPLVEQCNKLSCRHWISH